MKKLILFTASLMLVCGLSAQTPTMQTEKKAEPAKGAPAQKAMGKYCCVECDYSSDKPGDCPHHKKACIMEGSYFCPDCHTTSDKMGNCPNCGKPMKKMEKKAMKKEGEMKKMENKPSEKK